MRSIVKLDDTPVGIAAGVNAGVWTVGITRTGNAMGLSEREVAELDALEREQRIAAAAESFQAAGADYVIESAADLIPVLDELGE